MTVQWIRSNTAIDADPDMLAAAEMVGGWALVAYQTFVRCVKDQGSDRTGEIDDKFVTPAALARRSLFPRDEADRFAVALNALEQCGLVNRPCPGVWKLRDIKALKADPTGAERTERKRSHATDRDNFPVAQEKSHGVPRESRYMTRHDMTEQDNREPVAPAAVAAEPVSSTEELILEAPTPKAKPIKPVKAAVEQAFLEGLDRTEITALASAAFVGCKLEAIGWITPPQVKQLAVLAGLPGGDTLEADLRTVFAYLPHDSYWNGKRRGYDDRAPTLTMLFAKDHWHDTVRKAREWNKREQEEASDRAFSEKHNAEVWQRVAEDAKRKAAITPEEKQRGTDALNAMRSKLRAKEAEDEAAAQAAFDSSEAALRERGVKYGDKQ